MNLKHAPSLTSPVPHISTTRLLIWRLLFIIYLTHAPSFGNSGSSYILITPPPLANPAQAGFGINSKTQPLMVGDSVQQDPIVKVGVAKCR